MSLVSIGLPVYNGSRYLERAITSALAQTHDDIELVVSDNASTDETEAICRDYAASDRRVRYHRQEVNRGPAWNHKFVAWTSRSDYFRWYSYDDRMSPELIEKCFLAMRENPHVILTFPGTFVIDEHDEIVEEYRSDLPWQGDDPASRMRNLLEPLKRDSWLCFCTPIYGLVRRSVLVDTPMLNAHHSADNVLLVELALRGPWLFLPEPLFYNRRHPDSSIGDRPLVEIAQWFSPNSARPRYTPLLQTQLFKGYVDAVRRSPLSSAERKACLRVLKDWLATERNGRVIGHELRQRLIEATYVSARPLLRPLRNS